MAVLKLKPGAVSLSLFHHSYLSAFDKFHLVNKIPLVSLFCLLGNDYVRNCIGKDSEAESRSSDQFAVFFSRDTGRGSGGRCATHLLSLDGPSLRSLTVSGFCTIHIYFKMCQKVSFCLTSLVSQQENAN